jgi:hypothetical protein
MTGITYHVVNHLGKQHRFAHARTAKEACLAATLKGHQDIDDFDTRLEYFGFGRPPGYRRRGLVDRAPRKLRRLRQTINGSAEDVKHARENFPTDRGHERTAGIFHRHAAGKTLGRGQGDAPDSMSIELSHDLDGNLSGPACAQQGSNGRKKIIETDINDRTVYRNYRANIC